MISHLLRIRLGELSLGSFESFIEAANLSSNETVLSFIIERNSSRRAPLAATIRILRLFFSIELFLAIATIPFSNDLSGAKRELNTTQ